MSLVTWTKVNALLGADMVPVHVVVKLPSILNVARTHKSTVMAWLKTFMTVNFDHSILSQASFKNDDTFLHSQNHYLEYTEWYIQ